MGIYSIIRKVIDKLCCCSLKLTEEELEEIGENIDNIIEVLTDEEKNNEL